MSSKDELYNKVLEEIKNEYGRIWDKNISILECRMCKNDKFLLIIDSETRKGKDIVHFLVTCKKCGLKDGFSLNRDVFVLDDKNKTNTDEARKEYGMIWDRLGKVLTAAKNPSKWDVQSFLELLNTFGLKVSLKS